jgi:RNA polymerase sigma factor (sigma-70 family)
MVSLDGGAAPVLAATGDVSFLGCVIATTADVSTAIEVIGDEDAVYGVADRQARRAGTHLDLAGGSGQQTVTESVNDDFEVVVDSTAGQETLLRITIGRHCDFVVALPSGEPAAATPALTPARERQLVMAAAAGDSGAYAELVNAFLPSIARVARLYRGAGRVERAELLQEGVVGLLRAIRRFDPSLGTPFWAYATWWVRQAMQQLVAELGRPAVLSDRAQRSLARIREARRAHVQTYGREPSPSELAALVELSQEHVESLLAVERTSQPLPTRAGDDASEFQAGEVALVDPVAEEEYERVMSRLEIEDVRDLTNTLTGREREIVFRHYGLEGPPKTLREIGEELGISAERVRQIEERTLEKLRSATLNPSD